MYVVGSYTPHYRYVQYALQFVFNPVCNYPVLCKPTAGLPQWGLLTVTDRHLSPLC